MVVLPIVAIAGYYLFLHGLPACGPPRNTTLGAVYWWVPLGILFLQTLLLLLASMKHGVVPRVAVVTIVVVAIVTVVADAGIWLHFFAAGDCGE